MRVRLAPSKTCFTYKVVFRYWRRVVPNILCLVIFNAVSNVDFDSGINEDRMVVGRNGWGSGLDEVRTRGTVQRHLQNGRGTQAERDG